MGAAYLSPGTGCGICVARMHTCTCVRYRASFLAVKMLLGETAVGGGGVLERSL